ncbi:MAG: peptidase T [Ruminococcaceae bacterium]|nr:peptidase T [Oscillospiraceae bacterium]
MNVLERFLRYVKFETTSDEESESVPSTPTQKNFAEMLAGELREIGLADVRVDECGYVYGKLPATKDCETLDALGLIAHMDTSPAVSGKDVRPRTVEYTGGVLTLENGERLDPAVYPVLERYVGETLVLTDGNTLLGADDKAGVAEIVSACAYLVAHPEISHRAVCVAFTPDEEIGRGADHFCVEGFEAPVAYTVDGGTLGEIEYENFNAASARILVKGLNIHPGSAKGRMKNSVLMANELIAMLPPAETPAHTEGYEGFYHVTDIKGDENETRISMIVRDHDREKFEARKAFLVRLCAYLDEKWGSGSFELTLKDSYYNMREKIEPCMELIENARAAMESVGAEPLVRPIRGGTDGARLSFMGLPCPNLSTGGENFHSLHEFIPTAALEKMRDVLVYLVRV